MPTVTELRVQIEHAWRAVEHPGDFAPHCQRPDCPEIAAYFRTRTWRQVQWREMKRACGSSWDAPWHFLPDTAFRYFLPAFLCMYLEHMRRLDVLAEAIVRSVCPHQGWRARIEPIPDGQGAAILAFLRYATDTEPESELLRGGIAFWQHRLSRS